MFKKSNFWSFGFSKIQSFRRLDFRKPWLFEEFHIPGFASMRNGPACILDTGTTCLNVAGYLVANAMPPTPPAVHCVLWGRCTVENSHEHGRNARQFFDTAFSSALYCAAGTHKRTAVYVDGTLANFSMHLSGSLGTLPPFCYEKM